MIFILRTQEIRQNLIREINNLDLNKIWQAEIKEHDRKRTNPQNRYYWSLLNILEKETGHSAEDLHDFFKMDILGMREINFKGRTVAVPKSTTKLGTMDFVAYTDEIRARAMALGYTLPVPGYFGVET